MTKFIAVLAFALAASKNPSFAFIRVLDSKTAMYRAENPTMQIRHFVVNCGPEFDIVEFDVPAVSGFDVRIKDPKGTPPICTLTSANYK